MRNKWHPTQTQKSQWRETNAAELLFFRSQCSTREYETVECLFKFSKKLLRNGSFMQSYFLKQLCTKMIKQFLYKRHHHILTLQSHNIFQRQFRTSVSSTVHAFFQGLFHTTNPKYPKIYHALKELKIQIMNKMEN